MRLINVKTYEFVEFYRIPERYAVASHRWSAGNEVMLDDWKNRRRTETSGWHKVSGYTAEVQHHFPEIEYIWIDTCCVNQDSDREVSEAVNSMFRWYSQAEVCLAYLSDVENSRDINQFRRSEWFRRGWTLQELLAPRTVVFYSSDWEVIGHKGPNATRTGSVLSYGNWPLDSIISDITNIPTQVLHNGSEIASYSVGTRLAWMEGRETTREEDIVYSMFGIFDVVLPIMYGETADRAKRRLLKEIAGMSEAHPPPRQQALPGSADADRDTYNHDGNSTPNSGFARLAMYYFEKREDDEISFSAGELLINITALDEQWWIGTNQRGERGLFPASYTGPPNGKISETPRVPSKPKSIRNQSIGVGHTIGSQRTVPETTTAHTFKRPSIVGRIKNGVSIEQAIKESRTAAISGHNHTQSWDKD